MTCPSCGSPLPEGAATCPNCGAPTLSPTRISQRQLKAVPFREEQDVTAVRVQDVLSGRYRLEERIGEGGMGTVFIAHDQELDRKVAVKLLAANLMHDPEVLERFEREARLTARLDHPHIVPIYDVGRHQGRPFIVMKLLQGDSLAGRLRAKGGFTTEETVKLMRQLASGLDYIHAQGFIHRDIKAGNIFLSPEGHATILDFGILRAKAASTGITRTGMVMGTPHYMAPEQALGLKDVDHRVDLYALAVVLFECLTGTLPFEADSELRLIQLQAHAPPPEILDRAPWIPRPVADVVRKAMAKKPGDRFATAAELVDALELAWAEHKSSRPSLTAVPVVQGPAPTTSPSLRRVRSSQAAMPAVVMPAPEPPPPPRWPWLAALAVLLLAGTGAAVWLKTSRQPVELTPLQPSNTPLTPVALVDAGAPLEEEEEDDAGLEFIAYPGPVEDAGVLEEEDAGATATRLQPIPMAKRRGKMNVITTHAGEPYWAQVSIDGVPKGRTPILLEVPIGRHQVRVERPGFKPQEREVRVALGKPTIVKLELNP